MSKGRDLILSPAEKQLAEPLLNYLTPDRIEGKKEVVVNKPGQIGYEAYDSTWSFVDAPELTNDVLTQIMSLLAERTNQTYNVANPILSVKMPGGHRAQFVAGQQNAKRFSLCIRLSSERKFTLDNYVMSEADKKAAQEAVKNKKTILISGGTGSGKTSFMNAVIEFIPDDERLITIEDVPELIVPHENMCALLFANFQKSGGMSRQEAVNELLNACLRMRPDRIIMGEIRKENAFTFCSAINTGHSGSMATIHANTPEAALDAVINRVLLNGDTTESAINILRNQLKDDIYGVVQLERRGPKVHAYFRVLKEDEEDPFAVAEGEEQEKAVEQNSASVTQSVEHDGQAQQSHESGSY
ncbi:MAG: ATPase, T2SS/T4P/T4SS family [Alphaproteobacteria bacterium]|nr:ATPase, T2SS/T4P/T4SS family [Alphaproteobacteria bacterium]MDD9919375.1 ATPase, T2SS/T4P/T4SS family [Alphaproteobacteria bacterium]